MRIRVANVASRHANAMRVMNSVLAKKWSL